MGTATYATPGSVQSIELTGANDVLTNMGTFFGVYISGAGAFVTNQGTGYIQFSPGTRRSALYLTNGGTVVNQARSLAARTGVSE